ncbi:hypothetical protein MHBO_004888, partial [Bonamia ostreae]
LMPFSVLVHNSNDNNKNFKELIKSNKFPEMLCFLQNVCHKKQFSAINNAEKLRKRNSFRKGPQKVSLKPIRDYNVLITETERGFSIKSEKDFVTVVGDVTVTKGAWYYEILLENSGLMQLGWANEKFMPQNIESGCGDDNFSWAYDGSRQLIWNESLP